MRFHGDKYLPSVVDKSVSELLDRLAVRDLIENWVVWRDAGDWDRFRMVWHDDGWMSATWFQGPAADFIRVSREGWAKGVSIQHFLGGMTSILMDCERLHKPR